MATLCSDHPNRFITLKVPIPIVLRKRVDNVHFKTTKDKLHILNRWNYRYARLISGIEHIQWGSVGKTCTELLSRSVDTAKQASGNTSNAKTTDSTTRKFSKVRALKHLQGPAFAFLQEKGASVFRVKAVQLLFPPLSLYKLLFCLASRYFGILFRLQNSRHLHLNCFIPTNFQPKLAKQRNFQKQNARAPLNSHPLGFRPKKNGLIQK